MAQVTIIGLGTMGGSLGMALRQAVAQDQERESLELQVIGYDEDPRVEREARTVGAIDQRVGSLEEAVQEADIVVIAAAAQAVGETLQKIGPLLRPGCIVTDTANSKLQVMRWAEQFLPPEIPFIGGHPIFGPQYDVDWEAGIKGANPDFFSEAVYCLVPGQNSSDKSVATISGLVNLVGANPFFVDAMEHDGLLAGISHVPYVVTAAVLHTIAASASWRELKLLADPSFRYFAWPAAARQDEFLQACLTNRRPMVSWLDRVIAILSELRREIDDETSTGEVLQSVLEEARSARQDWIRRRDEREGEAGSKTMPEIEGPGQQLIHMFVPRFLRRRPPEEEDQ